MSTDDQIDRGMEQTLRDYYAARSRELEAPADTWARLERRLSAAAPIRLVWRKHVENTNGRGGDRRRRRIGHRRHQPGRQSV